METTKLDPLPKGPEICFILFHRNVDQNSFLHVSQPHPMQSFCTNLSINWSHSTSEVLSMSYGALFNIPVCHAGLLQPQIRILSKGCDFALQSPVVYSISHDFK